jgi:hypothetical protein
LKPRLFEFLKKNPGPSIIYVTLQKHTEELAIDLRRQGFKANAFHAGMDTSVKTELQDKFMREKNLVIVATIAFGMGIDKADIRNVVHFNIPSSLESYSQEIGRAGRDGKVSNCMFYVCAEDLHLREMFARGDLPSKKAVCDVVDDIFSPETYNLPIGGEIKRNQNSQGRDFDIRSTTLSNIYAQLELTHELIRASTPMYTKYTYAPGPQYGSQLNSDGSLAARAIMSFAKKAAKYYHMDVDMAASMSKIPRTDIVRKLNDLSDSGALELKPSGVLNVYKVYKPVPTKPEERQKIADAIFEVMEKREQEALTRTDQMLQLITDDKCFSRSLAQHFGDDLPHGKLECGHCSWCMTHKRVEQAPHPEVKLNTAAYKAILAKVPDRDDPRLLAKIAFGIASPRITALKLSKDPLFGSMADHTFKVFPDLYLLWGGILTIFPHRVFFSYSLSHAI